MNQTVVRVNPPRRASAVSVSTWLQLAKHYRDQARRESKAPAYARQLVLLARRCEHQANRLAAVQCMTAEVLDGVMRDIERGAMVEEKA